MEAVCCKAFEQETPSFIKDLLQTRMEKAGVIVLSYSAGYWMDGV